MANLNPILPKELHGWRRRKSRGELLAEAVYDREGIRRALGIGDSVLRQLREIGGLRGHEAGNKVFFVGSEVIAAIKKLGEAKQNDQEEAPQDAA
jgi:hypothetical protein